MVTRLLGRSRSAPGLLRKRPLNCSFASQRGELADLRTLSSADTHERSRHRMHRHLPPSPTADRLTAVRTQRTAVSEVVNCWNTAASTYIPAWRRARTETPTAPSATA